MCLTSKGAKRLIRFALGIAALFALSVSGRPASAADVIDLTCTPAPGPASRDPIVIIRVRIDGANWQVMHIAASGARYDRSAQYGMRDVSSPDRLAWAGALVGKPYIHMVGAVLLQNNVVSYVEVIRDDRKPGKVVESRALCFPTSVSGNPPAAPATEPRNSSDTVSIDAVPSFSRSADGPFSILLAEGGGRPTFIVSGVVPPDAAERFRRAVADHGVQKHAADVVLNSTGGSLMGGLALGRAIREMRFDTVLETIHDTAGCYSACAYAFLGGVSRRTGPGYIGFHQFSMATNGRMVDGAVVGTSQELMMALAAYLAEMGASPDLLAIATSATPTKIRVLSTQEADRLRVNFDDESSMKQWRLEALPTGLAMKTESETGSREAEIECATDANIQIALRWNRNDFEKLPSKSKLVDTSPKFTVNGIDDGSYSETVEDSASSLVVRFVIPRKVAKSLIVRPNDPGNFHFNAGIYTNLSNPEFNNLMMFMPVEGLSADLDALLTSCR